jgi:pimeloyl-ACP methyl ester carboxylesterase
MSDRPAIVVELLGSVTRFVYGRQYRTRVIEAGEGDPLVLIHGVGNSAECFARNVVRLGQRFHVYAVDALYHGFSTLEPYDAERRVLRQAEAVLDFMDAEGLAWAHLEGESMGAGIAFEIAMRHPERCGKLILNSGSYYIQFTREFDSPSGGMAGGAAYLMKVCRESITDPGPTSQRTRLEYFVADPAQVTDELVDLYGRLYSDPAINASMQRVFGMSAPRGNLAGWSEEEAGTLRVPALVLWTDQNKGQGVEIGEHLASVLPGAQLRIVAGACHWPQWERPEEHDAVVSEFLING